LQILLHVGMSIRRRGNPLCRRRPRQAGFTASLRGWDVGPRVSTRPVTEAPRTSSNVLEGR
jgi:hypothetical protein